MDGRSQSELVGRTAPRGSGPIAAQRGISQKEATEELLAEKQPSLDFASPAQLGGTVAFLCSAAADQITGTAISVDGGWTAR
jgi:3-hydroxybutyrate dehydrogenase